jgi:hypothetical protein
MTWQCSLLQLLMMGMDLRRVVRVVGPEHLVMPDRSVIMAVKGVNKDP